MKSGNTLLSSSMPGEVPNKTKYEEVEISQKVMELDLEELYQASKILNSSNALYYINSLTNILADGYKLNSIEQRILDKFFETYQVTYKSALAEAMKES